MKENKKTLNDVAGQKIRALRKIAGLTQNDLAKRLSMTYQQVQKYETGKNNISINMLSNIGKALEVDEMDILKSPELEEQISSLLKMVFDDSTTSLHRKKLMMNLDNLAPEIRRSLVKLIAVITEEYPQKAAH